MVVALLAWAAVRAMGGRDGLLGGAWKAWRVPGFVAPLRARQAIARLLRRGRADVGLLFDVDRIVDSMYDLLVIRGDVLNRLAQVRAIPKVLDLAGYARLKLRVSILDEEIERAQTCLDSLCARLLEAEMAFDQVTLDAAREILADMVRDVEQRVCLERRAASGMGAGTANDRAGQDRAPGT